MISLSTVEQPRSRHITDMAISEMIKPNGFYPERLIADRVWGNLIYEMQEYAKHQDSMPQAMEIAHQLAVLFPDKIDQIPLSVGDFEKGVGIYLVNIDAQDASFTEAFLSYLAHAKSKFPRHVEGFFLPRELFLKSKVDTEIEKYIHLNSFFEAYQLAVCFSAVSGKLYELPAGTDTTVLEGVINQLESTLWWELPINKTFSGMIRHFPSVRLYLPYAQTTMDNSANVSYFLRRVNDIFHSDKSYLKAVYGFAVLLADTVKITRNGLQISLPKQDTPKVESFNRPLPRKELP